MERLTANFKALGDSIRLRLFALLGQYDELCVCHLVDAMQLPQSTISRHLSVLRHAGLVSTRRDGKWMYYRLHGDIAKPLFALIYQHKDAQMQQDIEALRALLD